MERAVVVYDDTLEGVGSTLLRDDAESIEVDVAREAARRALFGRRTESRTVSRFELRRRLGSGGMGSVYAAHDPELDRTVAVKVLCSPDAGGLEQTELFVAEARSMAKLAHPNVVTVFEAGVVPDDGGRPAAFVVMELIDGPTLRAWVSESQPSWSEVVAAYADAGRGLSAVHEAGLVHRDVKPDNIMLGPDGRVRVMDFGLARDLGGAPSTTVETTEACVDAEHRTRSIAGTPAYMAPEQLRDGTTTHRSDQFSLCVSLFEALWGRRPYSGNSVPEIAECYRAATHPPEVPSRPLPRRMRGALMRGLHPDPAQRFESMRELVEALTPRRRRLASWIGLAAGCGAVAWGTWQADQHAEPCERGAEVFAEVWSVHEAEAVTHGLNATGVAYASDMADRVQESLDRYAHEWVQEHRTACLDTAVAGTQSEERLQERMDCLERRRKEVASLVGALSEATPTAAENAGSAAAGLEPPTRCRLDAYHSDAEPPAPEIAEEVDAIRESLVHVHTLWMLGEEESARGEAEGALVAAQRTGYAPVRGQASLVAGKYAMLLGDFSSATPLLVEAYSDARVSGDQLTAIDAALRLVSARPGDADSTKNSPAWLDVARAEIRVSGISEFDAELNYYEAQARGRAGDYSGAIEALERAAAITGPLCDDGDCAIHISVVEELGYNHSQLGRYREALDFARAALEIAVRTHPEGHPAVATAQLSLGRAFSGQRRYEEAVGPLEAAHAVYVSTFPEGNPNRATVMHMLGHAYAHTERVEEGLVLIRSAIREARVFGDALHTAAMLNQLAGVLSDKGDVDGAVAAWTEAVELLHEEFPDGHPAEAVFLGGLGSAYGKHGKHELAVDVLRQAEAARIGPTGPKNAAIDFLLARSLHALGSAEALEYAERAVELTSTVEPSRVAVSANRLLADLIEPTDHERARAIRDDIARRCAALSEAAARAAKCDDPAPEQSPRTP